MSPYEYLKNLAATGYQAAKASPYKRTVLIVLGLLLLAGGGYAFGRFAQPAKVVTVDKIQTVEVEKVVTKVETKIEYVKVASTNQAQKTHKETVETTNPDGTKVVKTTEDTDSNANSHSQENGSNVQYVDRIVEKEKIVKEEHVKIVEAAKPNWELGANVGVSVPYYLNYNQDPATVALKGVVVGARVGHRILGPVFLDLNANSQGVLGVGLSGQF